MNVKELIELLQKENPEREVIIQKDGEGNGHSPLADFWTGSYRAETTWYGEVGLDKLTDDLKKQGYSEEDVLDGTPALFLCPIN